MKHRRFFSLLSGLLLAAVTTASTFAGVVYEIAVTNHGTASPGSEHIEMFVDGMLLKMGVSADDSGTQGEMIFRGDRREMLIVDHDSKEYIVMDEKAMSQIAGQIDEAMSQMQEALKNVPEDQRAMVEKMMKQQMPNMQTPEKRSESELKPTGERAAHNGYPCVKYEVWRDGDKLQELWVTEWKNIEGGGDVVDTFAGMAEFFREMMDALPDLGDLEMGPAVDDNPFEYMNKLDGFPVVTLSFADGELESEASLESVTERDLDPDAFEPPKGYRLRTMDGAR